MIVSISNTYTHSLSLSITDKPCDPSVEDAIKDALRDSKSLRESKQFKGLWESMNEEEPTTNQSPKRLSAPNSTTTSTGRTPRRSIISKVPSTGNLKSTIQEKVDDAKNSLPDARSLIPSSVANGVEQLGELVPHVDTDALAEKVDLNRVKRLGRKSIGNLKKVAKESVEVVQEGTVKVQEVASEKWTVVTSLIAVELGYLGWSAVPWATKVNHLLPISPLRLADNSFCQFVDLW